MRHRCRRFSAAFLEASINELYLEQIDRNPHALAGLGAQQIAILGALWETIEQGKVLEKYQIALRVCCAEPFDKGAEPFQQTFSLIKMRNALIHYRPEWDDDLDVHKALETALNGKFPLNPLARHGALWFPTQCLGSGCAQWATGKATDFMTEFCKRLGIPNRVPMATGVTDIQNQTQPTIRTLEPEDAELLTLLESEPPCDWRPGHADDSQKLKP